MSTIFRYKYHLIAIMILMAVLFAGVKTKVTRVTKEAKDLPAVGTQGQLEHALELFPIQESGSILFLNADMDLRHYILSRVQRALPKAQKHRAFEIAHSVITQADHHGMDPLFLLAVIATESSFNLKARGRHGEIGLMQLLPETAKWLAPQAGLDATKLNLEDPSINIRLGATYFAQLRKRFNHHGTRYVSAYNMGAKNVRRLVRANREPNTYSAKVLGNYKKIYANLEKSQATEPAFWRQLASVK